MFSFKFICFIVGFMVLPLTGLFVNPTPQMLSKICLNRRNAYFFARTHQKIIFARTGVRTRCKRARARVLFLILFTLMLF